MTLPPLPEPEYWRVRRHDAPDYWILFMHKPVDALRDPEREVQPLLTADQMHAYAAAAVAAERKWRETVDDMLVCQHEIASDDPRESLHRLLNWHVSVALDPLVSSDAQALIDRGAAAARLAALEEAARMCDQVIEEVECGKGYAVGAAMCGRAIRSRAIHVPPTCTDSAEK